MTLTYILQVGDLIRFFHKEMEAYLVAEGLFDDELTEDGMWNFYSKVNLESVKKADDKITSAKFKKRTS